MVAVLRWTDLWLTWSRAVASVRKPSVSAALQAEDAKAARMEVAVKNRMVEYIFLSEFELIMAMKREDKVLFVIYHMVFCQILAVGVVSQWDFARFTSQVANILSAPSNQVSAPAFIIPAPSHHQISICVFGRGRL